MTLAAVMAAATCAAGDLTIVENGKARATLIVPEDEPKAETAAMEIQKAIKKPGSLTRQAKAKGMSISKFCAQGGLSGTTKKRCALAKTLKGMSKKKKKK